MRDLLTALVLVSLAAALLSPLLYTLRTLLQLKRKLVYPLLRVRGPHRQEPVTGEPKPIPEPAMNGWLTTPM